MNIFNKISLYILLASTVISFASCGMFGSGGDETDPPISVPKFMPDDDPLRVTTEPDKTWEPIETETKAPETKAPETLPPVTTAPVTKAPETTAPVTVIKGRNLSLSGRINPKDSNNIELHIEWTATQKADSPTASVTVKVFLDSYEVYIGARDNCKIILDGDTETFKTGVISRKSSAFQSSMIYSNTYEVLSPAGETVELPVSAEFFFGGKYGSKYFDWIKVDGTITLKDSNSRVPQTPTSSGSN